MVDRIVALQACLVEMACVDQYLPLLGMLILGAIFASASFLASSLLAPRRRPSDAKLAPYECGIVPEVDTPPRFPVRFYLVAMIFVIFDIEIVFLYPFAVEFKALGKFGLIEIALFSLVVFGTLLFLVAEGALSWGPVKRLTQGDAGEDVELDDRADHRGARRPRGIAAWRSRTSPTTSSPAGSRTSCAGRAGRRCGRPPSGSRAARSR